MKKKIITLMALLMVTAPALASADPAAADEYESGKGCYRELLRQGRNAAASKWDSCIAFFDAYYEDHSDSPKALSALFSKARLEQEGYETHGGEKRLEGAIKDYNELIKRYPQSSLADDALYRVGCLRQDALDQPDRARKAFSALLDRYPKGDMALQAKARLDRLGPGTEGALANAATKAEAPTAAVADGPVVETETTPPQKENAVAIVTPAAEEKNAELARKAKEVVAGDGIVESDVPPVESTKDSFATMGEVADAFNRATLLDIGIKRAAGSTTVDLILDRSVAHSIEFTDMGLRTGSPPELEVVMLHTKPARDLAKERLLESAQVDSYEIKRLILSSGIKVAFKLKPGSGYKLSRTEQGLRVTFGSNDVAAMAPPPLPEEISEKATGKASGLAGLSIVIDPGHGGEEEGAVGPDGTMEKDVTLAIGKRLAAELRRKLGINVYLTRDSDKTMTLDERTAFAVAKKADLFISIHANASRDKGITGVETYYLNNASDEAAERLAAQENKNSGRKLTEVEHIISTMLQNHDAAESMDLASQVQSKLTKKLKRAHGEIKDRGVRSALFYVLVGAKCPAILVETAFISNPKEEQRLTSEKYQGNVADAISDGVKGYLKLRESALVSL